MEVIPSPSSTHTPLLPAHVGIEDSREALGKIPIVFEASLVSVGPTPALLMYLHLHVVNLALRPGPRCEASPLML